MRQVPCIVALAITGVPHTVLAAPARFAVIVGNNVSDKAGTPKLRYADDDAIAIDKLLREAGVRTWLLVRPDDDTARLEPQLEPVGPPLAAALRQAMDELRRAVSAARGPTELLLFYSGHGDVQHGEGYILLEDLRLTRSLLRDEVLTTVGASQNHVIIDACKSYFVAFEKGAGGRRRHYTGAWTPPARAHKNTGFVLSTASDRDSHEWGRYQAGVFSYELRSGLRGAADANRDGAVTYAELGAFLHAANRNIPNARYRPEFVVRPPQDALQHELLRWSKPASLRFDTPELGHVYLEDAQGVRLADLHVRAGETRHLYLPSTRPVYLRKAHSPWEYTLRGNHPLASSSLKPEPVQVASRGALHLAFDRLFTAPFGRGDVQAFTQRFGQTQVERRHVLQTRNRRQRAARIGAGVATGGGALALAAGTASLVFRSRGQEGSQADRAAANDKLRVSNALVYTGVGIAVAGLASWLTAALWPDPERAKIRLTAGAAPSMHSSADCCPRSISSPRRFAVDGATLHLSGAW